MNPTPDAIPLGFMAQHVWEVGAGVLAVVVLGQGAILLIRGSSAPEAEGMNPRTVRVIACFMLLLGVGIGFAAFLVDAEAPGAHSRDHWGGPVGVVVLGVWVALMGALSMLRFRRPHPSRRQSGRSDGQRNGRW
jgi:hypothetical protein